MDRVSVSCNVFFENPFWIGVFERYHDGKLSVCKVTFGAEPKDYEVQSFLIENAYRLQFSPAVKAEIKTFLPNPKRMQREVHKQLQNTGMGTKSQQALKLQQEELKLERKSRKRDKKEEEKQRQFDLKQLKKKEKHKGR